MSDNEHSHAEDVVACELIKIPDSEAKNHRGRKQRSDLKPSRIRVRVGTALALLAGLLGTLTIFWREWIEALTGRDPDQHNGSVEWLVVGALGAVAVAVGIVARRHWRLLIAATE